MPQNNLAVSSPDETISKEARLWRAYFKHPTERRHEKLWSRYQPLVRHVAERFNDKMNGVFDPPALLDAGNVGLLDALAEFTAESSARFESVAVPMIRAAISRSLTVNHLKEKSHTHRLELADAIVHPGTAKTPALEKEIAAIQLHETLRRATRATQ